MSVLNLAKTSTLMTATERAKMVIALQLKALKEVSDKNINEDNLLDYDSPVSLTNIQIEQIVNSCPNSQARQYNFLMDLKKLVWNRLTERIRQDILTLQILEGKMAVMKYSLSMSPYFYFLIRDLERVPKVVTKEEYDKGVNRAREVERAQVLKMEGWYSLPEQEAYYRLVGEGKLEDGELEFYLSYINNFGETEDKLVEEKVSEIKAGIEEYKKEKERLEGEEPSSNFYSKYLGLSDEEIKVKVRVDYKGSFDIPAKDEVDTWNQAVSEEKERILKAAIDGKLKLKEDGIEAGSYYDWPERHQKFAGEPGAEKRGWNPLSEDCLEIGFANGEVMSSLEALDNHYWRGIVVATLHNQHNCGIHTPESIENRVQGTIESLKMFLPIKIIDSDFKKHERIIKVTGEGYDESLKEYAKTAKEKIVDILNNQALIEAVESDYLEGMELVGRTEDIPDFSFERVNTFIREFVFGHNKKIKGIVTSFNQLGGGFWDCHLEAIDDYLIPEDLKIDEKWVTNKLNHLEREASR